MATNKHDTMEKRIDKAIEAMEGRLEGMDDARLEMAGRELRDYFWCCFKCEELRAAIDSEGMMVEGPKGGLSENPKLNMLHKLTGRKSTMFSQIMRWLPKGDADGEQDELDAFIS